MRVRRLVHILCGVVLLGVVATTPTRALDARHTTHFTFRAPVALPGVTLPPGSYVFEVLNPDMSGDLVRVSTRDRNRTVRAAVHAPRASRSARRHEIDHHAR